MRVLQIIDILSRTGGLERCAQRFSQDLHARGHETLILEVRPERNRPPATLDGVPVEQPADPVARAAEWKPDIVLSHQAGDGPLLAGLCESHFVADLIQTPICPSAKLFRRTDQVCEHAMGLRCLFDWYAGPCGSTPSPVRALRVLRQHVSRAAALHRARLVLVASQWMRRHLIGEGIDPARIRIVDISEGVGPAAPIRPKRARTGEEVQVLYVGRVTYEKGIQYAIRALEDLPSQFTLRVVGDGWYRPTLEKLVGTLGLGSRVTFSGMLDATAVQAAYEAADVLVVPSVWPEPAGLIVPEGRAAGLPVVIFDRGGLVEWQTGGRVDGVTVATEVSPRGLAAAVVAALEGAPGEAVRQPAAVQSTDPQLKRWRMLDALIDAFEAQSGASGA